MSCDLLREGALRKRCVFLPSMGFLLQPAGINRPSGLAVCLDFSVWTPIRFSLPGFFSVSTSWDATLPLKQLPSSEMFWIVACFTPEARTLYKNVRWPPERKASKERRGFVRAVSRRCHICLWVYDLLWFCKWLRMQTFTNETLSTQMSCGVTLTITNKKIFHHYHMPLAGVTLYITTYQSLFGPKLPCSSVKAWNN